MFGKQKLEYFPAAIEITPSSIKLLQLARERNKYLIVKAAYLAFDQTEGASETAIKQSLERMARENQVKGEVVTSLPLDKIQIYSYILPNMPVNEIAAAVAWKVKQTLPPEANLEEVSFDYIYNVVGNKLPGSPRDIHILVFVVPREVVAKNLQLFKELSLELIAIEPKPYLIIDLLSSLKKISMDETALVLQIGPDSSSIIVVSGGYPYLIRPLAVTGSSFTQAIANYFQLDWFKAEALKRDKGLGELKLEPGGFEDKSEPHCFPALSSQLESLVLDIEHTFKHFSHQIFKSQVSAFSRVILADGSAALKNLDKFLADRLGVKVDLFDPGDFLKAISGGELPPSIKEHSAGFAGVAGLVARFIPIQ